MGIATAVHFIRGHPEMTFFQGGVVSKCRSDANFMAGLPLILDHKKNAFVILPPRSSLDVITCNRLFTSNVVAF